MTNNKLTEWRSTLDKCVENYQSTRAWYEENRDSPAALDDMERAEDQLTKFVRKCGFRVVLDLLDEIDELQERRKADSEPVAWEAIHHSEEMTDEVIFSTRQALDAFLAQAGWWPALTEIKPLYAAPQPVPVVPDEWTIQDAVKFCRETGRQDAGSAMEAWNACRAAMLNGGKS